MPDPVLFSIDEDGIGRLILNRPEVHNAFDDDVIGRMIAAIDKIEGTPNTRALVIQSNGKHFSAGADLNWMRRMADLTYEQNIADAGELGTLMSRLNLVPVPVLSVVQGAAYAGALGLLCCSDVVIASERATFCVSEVKLGLSPAVISPYVIAVIGQRAARRYFLSAEVFDVQQALRLGLVHEIASEEELAPMAGSIVDNWRRMGPNALRETKRLIRHVSGSHPDDETIRFTQELIASLRVSEEGQEGLSAFFEKRHPRWQQ